MPTSCVAAKCRSLGNTHKMHRFPTNPTRRMEWAAMVNRTNWQPSPYSYLCEEHFDENQYENGRADGRKLLKVNAIPTIFPPVQPQKRNSSTVTGHQADGPGHKQLKMIAPRPSSTPSSDPCHGIQDGINENSNPDTKKHDHTYCSPRLASRETDPSVTKENPESDGQILEAVEEDPVPSVSSAPLATTAPPTVPTAVPTTGVPSLLPETVFVVPSPGPSPVTVPIADRETAPLGTEMSVLGQNQTVVAPIVEESQLKEIFTVVTLPSHIVVPSKSTPVASGSQTVGSSGGGASLSPEAVKLNRLSKMFEALRKRMVLTQRLNHEYRRNLKRLQFSKDEQEAKFKQLFAPDQLAVLGKPSSRGMKWSNETIEKGLRLLFACGKKGYEMLLSQGQPLPSMRTLRGRLQPLKYEHLTRDGEGGSQESELENSMAESECDIANFVEESE